MKTSDYKVILDKFLSLFRRKPFDITKSPQRDWRWIIVIFLIINIISIGLNYYMLVLVYQGKFFNVNDIPNTTVNTIDRDSLTSVITYYENKQSRLNSLNKQAVQTVDPAL